MISNEKKGSSIVTARTRLRFRKARFLTALLPILCLVCSLNAAPAQAAPSWDIAMTHQNGWGAQGATDPNNRSTTSFDRGSGFNQYTIKVTNASGTEAAGGVPVSVADQLPEGLYLAGPLGEQVIAAGWDCATSGGLTAVTCKRVDVLAPGASYPAIVLRVHVLAAAADLVENSATVSGGNAGTASVSDSTVVTSNPFGLERFTTSVADSSGQPFTQAGGHPYSANSTFALKLTTKDNGTLTNAGGDPREIQTDLPPGFIGNAQNAPECSLYEFASSAGEFLSRCPANTAVGYAAINLDLFGIAQIIGGEASYGFGFPVLLYNLTPPRGTPAAFAFQVLGRPFALYAHLRSDGNYGITVGDYATGKTRPIAASLTFCSNGAAFAGECSSTPLPDWTGPLLTNPTQCGTPVTTMRASSYQDPDNYAVMDSYAGAPSAPQASSGQHTTTSPVAASDVTGCEALTSNWTSNPLYQPSIKVQPDNKQAETPAGYEVDLRVPQTNSEGTLANTALANSTVTLPKGVTLSPSAANGLTACSEEQMGLTSESPIRFNLEPAACADSAKVGTLTIKTQLLEEDLHGSVYVAAQNANPFHSKFAIYLGIDDPKTNTVVKLAGKVVPDPATGQLTTTVTENPQLPFDDLVLNFFGGSRAALVNPSLCGEYTTATALTPWSAADPANPTAAETATPSDSFKVESGPNGSACAASLEGRPFAPALSAGTESSKAGASSPFVLRLTRKDGEQELRSLDVVTPKGFTASLKGVSYCPQSGIEAAERNSSGAAELAQPSCPSASQVGTITTGAGAGETPFYVNGKAYLAGPYKGAPLSMVFITPAVAGPFDLGTVAVRAALHINPETAQVTVKSDPIPQILEGVPLRVRSIKVAVDRPGFTRNPTSCEPSAVSATVAGASGASSTPSNRFQVGDCSQLGFQPKLSLSLSGPTHRSAYPKLRAVLTTREGDANIGRAQVTLPKTQFLENAHIQTICTRVQYAAQACPAKSVYGYAKAWSPLLDQPLEGPVYLRSSNHQLPDMVASLDGQIHVDLVGRIDSVRARIRNTFETIPDAPVSKFELTMQGGKKGLLVNNTELCKTKSRATVLFNGQNGKTSDSNPVVKADCKKAKPQKKRNAKR